MPSARKGRTTRRVGDAPLASSRVSAAIRAPAIEPRVEVYPRPVGAASMISFEALVRMTQIRLCLLPEREPEVEAALVERGADRTNPANWASNDRHLVALWWDA